MTAPCTQQALFCSNDNVIKIPPPGIIFDQCMSPQLERYEVLRPSNWSRSLGGLGSIFGLGLAETSTYETSRLRDHTFYSFSPIFDVFLQFDMSPNLLTTFCPTKWTALGCSKMLTQ